MFGRFSFLVILGLTALLAGCGFIRKDASSKKSATLVYIADLHAQFEEHPEMFWPHGGGDDSHISTAGGVSRIVAEVEKIKSELPNQVLFLDAGDTIQGSASVALSNGEVAVAILNKMGIDLAVPGNWEVVYGTKVLKSIASRLNYEFVASNVLDSTSSKPVFHPYVIKNVNGLRMAIIGFTDPDVPTRQPPSYSDGFRYLSSDVLQPIIDKIRNENSADAIVLLTHIGLPKAVQLGETLSGVDVILSGDTHERTYEPVIRGKTWIVEPGSFGSFLGRVDLIQEADKSISKHWQLIELKSSEIKGNAGVENTVRAALAKANDSLNKKVGSTSGVLARYNVVDTSLDHMLADALRASTGTEIALSNGFRFAFPIVPGPILERDLWNFYPINTQIKTGKLSGRQLHEFLERELENVFSTDPAKQFGGWLPRLSGMSVTFNAKAPVNQRLQSVMVGSVPLDFKRLYTVTSCVREGDPDSTLCRIPNGTDIKVMKFDAHEAVRRYLKKNDPLPAAPFVPRFTALDLPKTVRSQYYLK